MKVLSLFDGMACGMLAMNAAKVGGVERYVAYEIDKYATQTSSHNFPMIEHKGDVFQADFTEYQGFDWLIGGSPCTYWSIAQTKNRETVASGIGWELFSQYVRALREAKPKYFIYENNKSMSKEIRKSISETFGFDPICINSALVSAQNRQRLYWCGIRTEEGIYRPAWIVQPEDRGINLKDILETNAGTWLDKGRALTASYYKGDTLDHVLEKNNRTLIAESIRPMTYELESVTTEDSGVIATLDMPGSHDILKRVYGTEGKSPTVTTCGGGNTEPKVFHKIADVGEYAITSAKGHMIGNIHTQDAACLRSERTEEAKQCRKAYESHEIHHGYSELNELHPRPDGKTNTLTTVQKDNLIIEPVGAVYSPEQKAFNVIERIKPLTENEMDYMVRDHQDQRWSFCNKPGEEDKSKCLVANVSKGVPYNIVAEPLVVKEATSKGYTEITPGDCVDMSMPNSKTRRGRNMEKKSNCLQTSCQFYQYCGTQKFPIYEVRDGMIEVKGKRYPIKLIDGYYIIRKLTVRECMRLQTVPEDYEFPVSNSQAYKMLGNGWTVEVIAHLIKSILAN